MDGPLEDRELMESWGQPGDSIKGSKHSDLDTLPTLFSQPFLPMPI